MNKHVKHMRHGKRHIARSTLETSLLAHNDKLPVSGAAHTPGNGREEPIGIGTKALAKLARRVLDHRRRRN
jgi:hypothetical protein